MDGYFQLVAELRRVRSELGDQPSLRALHRLTGSSVGSITKWLFHDRLPQDVGPLLKVVSAIRAEAEGRGLLDPRVITLTDQNTWRKAHKDEQDRRSARIGTGVRAGVARRSLVEHRPGLAISKCDPLLLGVRRGIAPDSEAGAAPDLTRFVRRTYDGELRRRVAAGGVVALVGDSSTGKSRSAWEAVRALGAGWRLWQPGSWADLEWVRTKTVIWLNDARQHLSEDNAEQLARLVSDVDRSPVTVLITLWGEDWDELTADAVPGTADSRYWARTLLTSQTSIKVPEAFSPLDQHDLDAAVRADPRWAQAVRDVGSGAVVQYFAGVPVLLDLYQSGPRMARALIEAAVDARRLGVRSLLPQDFLLDAAVGYPSDPEWARFNGTDWSSTALAQVSAPVRGLQGPLSPEAPRSRGTSMPLGYVLTPYLEQFGREDRAAKLPPESFWTAARAHLLPADWARLAVGCDRRGLFRTGASFRRAAVQAGQVADAGELLRRVPDAGAELVRWLLDHVQTADLGEVQDLGAALTERGAVEATAELYRRAAHDIDLSTWGIRALVEALVSIGDAAATAAFLIREPGRLLPAEDDGLVEPLAKLDPEAAEQLVTRLLAAPGFRGPYLIEALFRAGLSHRVADVARAIPVGGDAYNLVPLVQVLHANGFDDDVRRLMGAGVPVPHSTEEAAALLSVLDDLDDTTSAAALIDAINHDDRLSRRHSWSPELLASIPVRFRDRLTLREPPKTADGSTKPRLLIRKVYLSVEDEVIDQAEALRSQPRTALDERIEDVDLTDPFKLLVLLRVLSDRPDEKAALARRIDPDRLVMTPGSVAGLATELGPGKLAREIMVRLTAEADSWNSKNNRRIVIPALQKLGLTDVVDGLTERYANGGAYSDFLAANPDRLYRFRYGREPDGTPSLHWKWSDLGPESENESR